MPTRSNRIEVDLKLLQDRNIEKLLEFGKQFDTSIGRLADALKTQEERMEDGGASAAVGRAGKLSPNASTGANIQGPPRQQARNPGATGGGSGDFYNGGEGIGLPPVGPYGWEGSGSYAGPGGIPEGSFEQQFVRAQRRIGGVPVGLRQWLGYMAEGGLTPAQKAAGEVDRLAGLRNIAGQVNSALFTGQAISANASLAYQHMQGAFGAILGPTQLGQNLGASREGGILGTGLFSPGFNRGVSEVWQTALAGSFGFNPNYSMGEARSARQATQDFGYYGTMANVINDQLKQLKIHQNVDPNTAMAFLDPLVRFGTPAQSSEQLVNALRALPAAANAASMNLQTFIKSLTGTSEQLAQQTGQQPGQFIAPLSAYTATTGLAPERAGELFSNQNMWLAAAMSGKSIAQVYEEPSVARNMEFGVSLFKSATKGYSAEQLLAMRKSNPQKYYQVMSGVYAMWGTDHNIFAGLTPLDYIRSQVRNHGKLLQHMQLTQNINAVDPTKSGSVNQIQHLLNSYGEGLGGKFGQWRNEYLHHHQIKTEGDLRKYRAQARDHAMSMLGEHQKKAAQKAAVTVELGPKARQWFQILTKQTGQESSKADSNHKGFFARLANGDLGREISDDVTYPFRHPGKSAATVEAGIEDTGHFLKKQLIDHALSNLGF